MIQRRLRLADSCRMNLETIEGLHDVSERRVRVLDEVEQSNAIKRDEEELTRLTVGSSFVLLNKLYA